MKMTKARTNLAGALLALTVALSSFSAIAQQKFQFSVGDALVTWTAIDTVEATPDEGPDAFMHRAGAMMTAWTAQTNHEACAEICQASDGRLVLPIGTLGAHTACATGPQMCPAGTTSVGEYIHTHPERRYRPNAVDVAMTTMTGVGVARNDAGSARTWFSEADYQRPGYLAQPGGRLLYQSGRGTARSVAAP